MRHLLRFAPMAAWIMLSLSFGPSSWSRADLARQTARQAIATPLRRLGTTSSRAATSSLGRRAETLAARHGDEVLTALRRSGPAALDLIEAAGPQSRLAARLLARHGDEATRLVAHPRQLALAARFGDDAARALIRHGAVAEPAIAQFGPPAARALATLSPRQARRLAILAESGTLSRLGRTEELLEVIGRHGDRALQFIWRHKGALAVTALLTTFLADPEPYLAGTRDLGSATLKTVARPIVAVPSKVAGSLGRLLAPGLAVVAIIMAILILGIRRLQRWSRRIVRKPRKSKDFGL